MALRTKVKVGNITNLSDARYCAGMGVDWLGFRSQTIDPRIFQEITGWVSGPEFVVELDAADGVQKFSDYHAKWVELSSPHLTKLQDFAHASILFRLGLSEYESLKKELLQHKSAIRYIIADQGTANTTTDGQVLSEIRKDFKVLIGFNINEESLNNQWTTIDGLCLQGTEEIKPGLKDYSDLSSILEKLEEE